MPGSNSELPGYLGDLLAHVAICRYLNFIANSWLAILARCLADVMMRCRGWFLFRGACILFRGAYPCLDLIRRLPPHRHTARNSIVTPSSVLIIIHTHAHSHTHAPHWWPDQFTVVPWTRNPSRVPYRPDTTPRLEPNNYLPINRGCIVNPFNLKWLIKRTIIAPHVTANITARWRYGAVSCLVCIPRCLDLISKWWISIFPVNNYFHASRFR